MERIVDTEVKLIPYYPNYAESLGWYQDLDVCKQVDDIDYVYTLDRLKAMYDYLSSRGDCYYIQYLGRLVGDITLAEGEISIVISKEYQNKHIGRRCVKNMLELAKEKGLKRVTAEIYAFNRQSQTMFSSIGFEHIEENLYAIDL